MNSGPLGLGSARDSSADFDSVTVRFRQSRGGPVTAAPLASTSVECLSAATPWRTFRWYKGQKHYSGWYWSATDLCSVIYESRLELCRLLYADFDPSVSRIVAQPFLLKSGVKSVTRQHIPDYLLITDTGPVVVDVKPKDRIKDTVVADTLAWTRAAIEHRGWGYEVSSEPPAVEMGNIRFLSGFRRKAQFRRDLVSDLRTADLDTLTIDAAISRCASWPEPSVRSALLHLVWLRYFNIDLARPLSGSHVLMPGVSR